MKKLIDVYPYRIVNDEIEFLIFLRSSKKIYANQWRMIGGKVKNEETYWEAALRELDEETQLKPELFWTIPSINQFYEASSDQIHSIPAFAAKLPSNAEPLMDEEHTEFKWISVKEVESHIHWPEQQRLMRLVHHILINDQLLPQWEIDLS